MKRVKCGLLTFVAVAAFLSTSAGCQQMLGPIKPREKMMLFNGTDFAGWKLFIPDKTVEVHDVWSVSDGAVRCEGVPHGYMRTRAKYANYRLHLEWRWPEKPTNSGVLLHAGGRDQVWPVTIECQLKSGSAGDFVLINGPGITVDGVDKQDKDKQFVSVKKKKPTNEKPAGQWNSYDIHCEGDEIRCYVNGLLQNEGTDATITQGWICLQSEGSPIEFRNIYLEPAKK
ncbi:MAG: 3-keto-disaccharide hydrolase [Planctomycetota bacterium]